MNLNKLSRSLYRISRATRDFRAIEQGPSAIGRRIVRRTVYRKSNQLTAALLRSIFGKR